jgi:preprotein translocase subunit SecG
VIGLLTAVHVLVAIVLVLAVLLQSARGADLAGAFGGMGSQTAFGPRGTATFLSKATVTLAVVFMLTSITLAVMGNQLRGTGGPTVLGDEPAAATEPGAAPAPGTTTPEGGTQIPGLPPGTRVRVTPPPQPVQPAAETPAAETPAETPPPAAPAGQ